MKLLTNRTRKMDVILIIVGAFIMAVGINLVYEPMDLVTGGFSGLAIIIKYFTKGFIHGGIPIWVSNILLNVPLFLAAFLLKGKKFVGKTLFATAVLSVALYIVPSFDIVYHDLLLASVFGGVIGGIGLGMVFITMASTGGTDMLGMIIHEFIPHYTIAQVIFVIDGAIVLLGAATFGLNKALYSVIAVYITAKVMDGMLEGLKFAKLTYIISDQYEEIAKEIMDKLDRGATGLHATGMYSNDEKKMIFCVVSKKEIIELKNIVGGIDPKAFIIVSDVREVLGEGFIEYKQ
ncbi:membrane protein [Anaeromicropila herbilytica]|uniref:Membrane protein n=2 Tax=Anaeromicropila herbilytica TaxID=2785025 RepID=A0A7R7EPJ8_9FIRM|nr:YitT family protein [Anaeromicropila herbilytica]BCN32653.1 membrane protein [Anaeromicropila herbilytica]